MIDSMVWDEYLHFYEHRLDEARTHSELQFLTRELGMDGPMDVLDIACGFGRHSIALTEAGHRVTGVDAHVPFLDRARAEAARKGADVRFVQEDMRELKYEGCFDRALCLFTSFGYFDDADNERIAAGACRALRPGGMLCLDTINRDAWLTHANPAALTEKGEDVMLDKNTFDPITGRVNTQRIIFREGVRREGRFFLRIYSATELRTLLLRVGFSAVRFFGDWDSEKPFDGRSFRLVAVASK